MAGHKLRAKRGSMALSPIAAAEEENKHPGRAGDTLGFRFS